jgi:hypothetical protein
LLIIEFRAALRATASFALEFELCARANTNHESTPDEGAIASLLHQFQVAFNGCWKLPSYRSIAVDSSGRQAFQLAMTAGNA